MTAATYQEARDRAYAAWRKTQAQLELELELDETPTLPPLPPGLGVSSSPTAHPLAPNHAATPPVGLTASVHVAAPLATSRGSAPPSHPRPREV